MRILAIIPCIGLCVLFGWSFSSENTPAEESPPVVWNLDDLPKTESTVDDIPVVEEFPEEENTPIPETPCTCSPNCNCGEGCHCLPGECHCPNCPGNTSRIIKPELAHQILLFSAEWCGPCRSAHEFIDELESFGWDVTVVDIDEHPELASDFGIRSIPQWVILDNGVEEARTSEHSNIHRLYWWMKWCVEHPM